MDRKGFIGLIGGIVAAPLVARLPKSHVKNQPTRRIDLGPDFSHWEVEYREGEWFPWKFLSNNIKADIYFVPTATPGLNQYRSFGFDIDGNLLGKNGLIIQEVALPMHIATCL